MLSCCEEAAIGERHRDIDHSCWLEVGASMDLDHLRISATSSLDSPPARIDEPAPGERQGFRIRIEILIDNSKAGVHWSTVPHIYVGDDNRK